MRRIAHLAHVLPRAPRSGQQTHVSDIGKPIARSDRTERRIVIVPLPIDALDDALDIAHRRINKDIAIQLRRNVLNRRIARTNDGDRAPNELFPIFPTRQPAARTERLERVEDGLPGGERVGFDVEEEVERRVWCAFVDAVPCSLRGSSGRSLGITPLEDTNERINVQRCECSALRECFELVADVERRRGRHEPYVRFDG